MYKNLKNTDLNIFPIVLGSDYYGDAISEETAFKNMDLYIENGGNIVDTARLYVSGKSEEIIGRYIRSRGLKNKLIISTKAAHPPVGHMEINRLSCAEIESDVDASLSALGVDTIDILWLHRDDVKVPAEEVVDSMEKIIKKGKVRYWGVSTGQEKEWKKPTNMPKKAESQK